MKEPKDKLVSAAELAQKLGVSSAYISSAKKQGKFEGCMYGKKFYFGKTCKALGRDPSNIQASKQTELQKKVKKPQKDEELELDEDLDDEEYEAKELLEQILKAIKDPRTTKDRNKLDGLKIKASMLKEYFLAKNEEIRNRKLEADLFTKDDVTKIIGFSMNMLRAALINLPNNYAVNLENLTQKQIKEYVADDINKILENFQKVEERF